MTIVVTPDGRDLEVAVSGPAGGTPLVFHHGTPGGVTRFRPIERAAHARGLRLVTFARAGYGRSDRRPRRTVVSVVDDVVAVLDHLDAPRFLVAGWSGGGPHALATAALLPDRVAGCLTIGGAGPYGADGLDFTAGMGEQNVEEFGLAGKGEDALRPELESQAADLRDAGPADLVAEMSSLLPAPDRDALAAGLGVDLAAGFHSGLAAGADGWVDDDLAFVRPWGFQPGDIRVPTFLWQGAEDLMVPPAHGRWLAEHIPTAVARPRPGHGHLSIVPDRVTTMLDELAATL